MRNNKRTINRDFSNFSSASNDAPSKKKSRLIVSFTDENIINCAQNNIVIDTLEIESDSESMKNLSLKLGVPQVMQSKISNESMLYNIDDQQVKNDTQYEQLINEINTLTQENENERADLNNKIKKVKKKNFFIFNYNYLFIFFKEKEKNKKLNEEIKENNSHYKKKSEKKNKEIEDYKIQILVLTDQKNVIFKTKYDI